MKRNEVIQQLEKVAVFARQAAAELERGETALALDDMANAYAAHEYLRLALKDREGFAELLLDMDGQATTLAGPENQTAVECFALPTARGILYYAWLVHADGRLDHVQDYDKREVVKYVRQKQTEGFQVQQNPPVL